MLKKLLLNFSFRFLIKLYFKANIKLVYFVTTNFLAYLLYLSCIIFSYFNFGLKENFNFFFACTFFVAYVLAQSLQLSLLCNVKIIRVWLENCLGREFLIFHLGNNLYDKPLYMLLIGLCMLYIIRAGSFYLGQL